MMEWISVNKEKPKNCEVVLVFDKWDDRFYVEVAEYTEYLNSFYDTCGEREIVGVKYWMPLPPAPKEDA